MATEHNETPKNELREYLDTIAVGEIRKLKQKMIDGTMSTHYIFKNWTRGITKVPLLERTVINRISNEYNGKEVFKIETDDHDTENHATET